MTRFPSPAQEGTLNPPSHYAGVPSFALRFRFTRGVQPIVVLLCVCGVLLFLYLAHEIAEGDRWSLDSAILLALRRPGDLHTPIGPLWMQQSAIDISALGGFTVLWLLSAVVVGYLLLIRRREEALLLAISLIAASLLNAGIKELVRRPRPFVVPHLANVSNASFPSGHAMLSATTYLTMAVLLARLQTGLWARIYIHTLAIGLVLLIGLSRIYLGVHWPSDVLGGWCLGAAWSLGFSLLAASRLKPAPAR